MRYNYTKTYSPISFEELQQKSKTTKSTNKKQALEPIEVIGNSRQICTKWWGQAWCKNLEKYADYENRIARGKRYVRAGAVIDLKIKKGVVDAKVQGTRRKPYDICIHIAPLLKEAVDNIVSKCSKLKNVEELIKGNIPLQMQELFTGRDGLFPTPKEIAFDCSCPDWASMCKHVAAVLYGVGIRLDENPLLFFELRGIEYEQFVGAAIEIRIEEMIANENKPSNRIITEKSIMNIFGI